MRRPSQTSAARSPRPAATWRSTKWAAALKRRGSASYGSGESARHVMLQLRLDRYGGRLGLPAGGLEPVLVPRADFTGVEVETGTAQLFTRMQHVEPYAGRGRRGGVRGALASLREWGARQDRDGAQRHPQPVVVGPPG